MLQTIFWVCFGVGVGFVVLSFILGEVFGVFGGGSGSCSTGGGSGSATPMKPAIIALFLAVFGGSGLIFSQVFYLWFIIVPLALVAAVIVAGAVFRFVFVPLWRRQNTSSQPIQSFVDTRATVILAIAEGRFGEITYSANGNTYTSPAKSVDGAPIPRDSIVDIVRIDDGVFYVKAVPQ